MIKQRDAVIGRLVTTNYEGRGSQITEIPYSRRITLIPDPPVFEGKNLDTWLSRIQNKLRANADPYQTKDSKITYIESRIGNKAADHLIPRITNPLDRF